VNDETPKDGAKLQQIKIYEYDMRQNGAFAAPFGLIGRPGACIQIGAVFAFSTAPRFEPLVSRYA
jgi:hypothetical protein